MNKSSVLLTKDAVERIKTSYKDSIFTEDINKQFSTIMSLHLNIKKFKLPQYISVLVSCVFRWFYGWVIPRISPSHHHPYSPSSLYAETKIEHSNKYIIDSHCICGITSAQSYLFLYFMNYNHIVLEEWSIIHIW